MKRITFGFAVLLLAVAASDVKPIVVAKSFAKAVADGSDYDLVISEPLSSATLAELTLLKGCRVGLVEQITVDRYGLQWRCPRSTKPARTAALVDIRDGKVVKVLMSTVERQEVSF